MSTISAIPIRLELTTRSNPPVPPVDINTDETPRIWRGEDFAFQIGIFDARGFCVDLSNLAFLEVDIFPVPTPRSNIYTNQTYSPYSHLPYPTVPPAPLLSVTILANAITPTIDRDAWESGDAQQAEAVFTWIQTQSLNLAGLNFKNFYVVVHGMTQSGTRVTYGGGTLEVWESGAQGIYLPNTIAPLIVPDNTIFLIEENSQLLFSQPITVDGDMIVDGYLVEPGGSTPTAPDFDPSDFSSDFQTS